MEKMKLPLVQSFFFFFYMLQRFTHDFLGSTHTHTHTELILKSQKLSVIECGHYKDWGLRVEIKLYYVDALAKR